MGDEWSVLDKAFSRALGRDLDRLRKIKRTKVELAVDIRKRLFPESPSPQVKDKVDRWLSGQLPKTGNRGEYNRVEVLEAVQTLVSSYYEAENDAGLVLNTDYVKEFRGQNDEPDPLVATVHELTPPLSSSAAEGSSSVGDIHLPRSWALLRHRKGDWILRTGPGGSVLNAANGMSLIRHRSGDHQASLAVAPDSRVTAQLRDGTLHIAWINRVDASLSPWPTGFDSQLWAGEARLLAVACAGWRDVRCIISASSATYDVRLSSDGVDVRQHAAGPSRAAVCMGNQIATIDEQGQARDPWLMRRVWLDEYDSLDLGVSGDTNLLVAIGDGDSMGARQMTWSWPDAVNHTRDVGPNAMGIVRQIQDEVPASVAFSDGRELDLYESCGERCSSHGRAEIALEIKI